MYARQSISVYGTRHTISEHRTHSARMRQTHTHRTAATSLGSLRRARSACARVATVTCGIATAPMGLMDDVVESLVVSSYQ